MSLSEKLKTLEPELGNAVERALAELSEEDRNNWTEALHSGLWTQKTLASLLNEEVGSEVSANQVKDWKRR